ncbi:hypothetical protein A1O7_02891 [Cladophialophora yegresii CBS 114405]|uniref:Uncharacterized protein n=1 Tax=Cladophialophora yegresii CBS 114405 TaxID=1182544 RepID=W9WVZ4_9EURO|nr:uncharacterized protein A1O7_02891 [Cladophialophora yegresii CBS 114405]EXJ62454.1 hypothetical protein A1O7_02891 [Cladophialophora yegresii CBS 114405]
MANASDIITYIGVPLAVLGVLPILYTFMLSILTQRRIRSLLVHHGHRPVSTSRPHDGFTLRSSPMTSMVEVELPRYTIAPLDRHEEEYWVGTEEGIDAGSHEHHHLLERGDRAESTLSMIEEGRVRGYLRGGSWRAFHWRKLIVGRKLYRIQYEDELREPPAEVGFEALVVFLLDWGAVPDSMGWEKLRTGGLWTPSGTVLLRRTGSTQDHEEGEEKMRRQRASDWVLRTSMPDESDGILSLTVRWPRNDGALGLGGSASASVAEMRGAASLPPGWGRLRQPAPLEANDKRAENEKDLPARIEELKAAHKHSVDSTSFRFHAEDNRIQRLLWEHNDVETGFVCEPFRYYEQSTAGLWFTCVTSALLSQKGPGGLWAFEIPADIKTFVRKDSIPCGVMVILGLLPEQDAPQWSSERDNRNEGAERGRIQHQKLTARMAAERLEASMPPEQARIHRANRQAKDLQEFHNEMVASNAARHERGERMIKDAIASPRMSIKKVAEACLVWLIEKGEVGKEWTVEQLAEAVLYLIVVDLQRQRRAEEGQNVDQGDASGIVRILDEWMSWATAGGMKKQQYHMLEGEKDKLALCLAVSLVAVVAESLNSSSAGRGKVGLDMLECLQLWRKVRLG